MSKTCSKCGVEKTLDSFHIARRNSDGRCGQCKQCTAELNREWYRKNRDRHLANTKKNKCPIKARERDAKYRKSGKRKKYAREYARRRRKEDLQFRLSSIIRSRVYNGLKGKASPASVSASLGCSIEDFVIYIQAKFQPGMSWDNYGPSTWHLDHIRPLCSFDLTDANELAAACHFTNYQPLWAEDNFKKGGKDVF